MVLWREKTHIQIQNKTNNNNKPTQKTTTTKQPNQNNRYPQVEFPYNSMEKQPQQCAWIFFHDSLIQKHLEDTRNSLNEKEIKEDKSVRL